MNTEVTCEHCGVINGHDFERCRDVLAHALASAQRARDLAETLIREARIECTLCRGKGYWSTDVYKNQICACKAGKVLVEKADAALRERAEALTAALRDIKARHTRWYMDEKSCDAEYAVRDMESIAVAALSATPPEAREPKPQEVTLDWNSVLDAPPRDAPKSEDQLAAEYEAAQSESMLVTKEEQAAIDAAYASPPSPGTSDEAEDEPAGIRRALDKMAGVPVSPDVWLDANEGDKTSEGDGKARSVSGPEAPSPSGGSSPGTSPRDEAEHPWAAFLFSHNACPQHRRSPLRRPTSMCRSCEHRQRRGNTMSKWPTKVIVWVDLGVNRWRRVKDRKDERDVAATYDDVRIYVLQPPPRKRVKRAPKRRKAK